MSRPKNVNPVENEGVIEVTEESLLNQCESCCYDLHPGYPYKCMYNEILHQYKMRLKKAQAEMNDRDMVISVLKEQHSKMENYCRCTLEDMRNVKVKYMQLLQEMENMKKMNTPKPSNEKTEPLENYIRSEVEVWKRENKEILGKIEMIDCDVQKLLHLVSESPKTNSAREIDDRMAKLEKIIGEQSNILSILNSKVTENAKCFTCPERMVGQKLEEMPKKTGDDKKDSSSELPYAKPNEWDKAKIMKDVATNTEPESRKSVSFINAGDISVNSEEIVKETAPEKKIMYEQYGAVDTSDGSSTISEIPRRSEHENSSGSSLGSRTPNYYDNLDLNDNSGKSNSTDTKPNAPETIPNQFENSKDNIEEQKPASAREEPMEDLLEIADKERKFFGPYAVPLTSETNTPNSEVSEQPSRDERIFHELPVEVENPEKSAQDFEGFNEFEHIESSFYAGQKNKENFYRFHDEMNPEITDPPSREAPNDVYKEGNEGQLVVYQGDKNDSKQIPFDTPRGSGNDLKIEETGSFEPTQGVQRFPLENEKEVSETKSRDSSENVRNKSSNESNEKTTQPEKIIQEFPQSEEEIVKKFEAPREQVPPSKTDPYEESISKTPLIAIDPTPQPEINDSKQTERILQEVFMKSSLEDSLKRTINRLNDILDNAGKEISVLHGLKDDISKFLNEEGLKDIPSIKRNTENLNNILNKIWGDLNDLKSDMRNVLKNQDGQLKERQAMDENNKSEKNKVLETVKSLEKRLCKCSKVDPKENVSTVCIQPQKTCTCRYKMISLERKKNDPSTPEKNGCLNGMGSRQA